MTATTATTSDSTAMHQLSERFARFMESPDPASDVFAEDVFLDLLPPYWRFQLQGRDALAAQLKQIAQGDIRIDILRTIPTATGFLTEHLEHQEVNGEDLTARRVWLCDVQDGRVTDTTCYCNGEWNDELRARHAAEAPMMRP